MLMSRFIQHSIFVVIALSFFTSCIRENSSFPNDNKGNFEALWQIIDERYCYLDSKNIDWDKTYTKYSVLIDTVSSKYGLFNLFSEMLDELKDGHVNLYSEFNRSRYWKWYTDYPSNFSSKLIYNKNYLGANYRIAGPLQYNVISNGEIGYIYYGSFANGFSDSNIRSIFEFFKNSKGVIIDVRNNGGGNITNSETLASYFFKEKTLTNYIQQKTGKGHSDFSEPKAIYTEPHKTLRWERPVVILTNRMSYSATNEFACRMNFAPNSKIIGDKTGGGGGLPLSSELPNGWLIRFSAVPMLDANLNDIETGINPTIKVDLSQSDETKGIDTIIEKAINEIQNWTNL